MYKVIVTLEGLKESRTDALAFAARVKWSLSRLPIAGSVRVADAKTGALLFHEPLDGSAALD